jgi:hypothetical protein
MCVSLRFLSLTRPPLSSSPPLQLYVVVFGDLPWDSARQSDSRFATFSRNGGVRENTYPFCLCPSAIFELFSLTLAVDPRVRGSMEDVACVLANNWHSFRLLSSRRDYAALRPTAAVLQDRTNINNINSNNSSLSVASPVKCVSSSTNSNSSTNSSSGSVKLDTQRGLVDALEPADENDNGGYDDFEYDGFADDGSDSSSVV